MPRFRRFAGAADSSSEGVSQPTAKRKKVDAQETVRRDWIQRLAEAVPQVGIGPTKKPPPDEKKRSRNDNDEDLDDKPIKRPNVPRPLQSEAAAAAPPPPPPRQATNQCSLSMFNYTLDLLKGDIKKKSDTLRKSRVLETWEYPSLAGANEIECEGDMRCRLIDEALAYVQNKGLKLSPAQKVILKGVRATSLVQFYGDTIQYHLPRLLGENGASELRSEMLIFMARRQGKSTIVSLIAACELVTQPLGHDICIYSNNGRASRMLLMMIYKFVRILATQEAGFGGKIKNLDKNQGMSYTTRWGTVNYLWAYPASGENLRGTGSKETTGTVILEELNSMKAADLNKIIAPTLVRKRVKLWGITTISGFDSFVTPLANARYPDGRKVMLVLNFEMVCEDCKAKGEPEKCKCLMADLPHWHMSSQLEKLEILLANDLDTFMAEMRNMPGDASITPAFDPLDVAHLAKPESVMRMAEITSDKIFVAIDPACGGDTSKMAIVSSIFVNGLMVVRTILYCVCVCVCVWRERSEAEPPKTEVENGKRKADPFWRTIASDPAPTA